MEYFPTNLKNFCYKDICIAPTVFGLLKSPGFCPNKVVDVFIIFFLASRSWIHDNNKSFYQFVFPLDEIESLQLTQTCQKCFCFFQKAFFINNDFIDLIGKQTCIWLQSYID